MSVSDSTVMILIGILVNYLVVYQQNRLWGSIFYLVLGLGIMAVDQGTIHMLVGTFISLTGLFMAIFHIFISKKN